MKGQFVILIEEMQSAGQGWKLETFFSVFYFTFKNFLDYRLLLLLIQKTHKSLKMY